MMSVLQGVRIATGALALLGALPAAAVEVGKASAVNPAATANFRTITIGASIAHKERIVTTAAGSVQLLFVDKTSMTIGPNSDLTIDEYVYDPNAATGKLAATLGKGALRFVGGQISHSGDAEIKTANAVIGIRGGIAVVLPGEVDGMVGEISVTNPAGTVVLYPGERTTILVPGVPPSPPEPITPESLANKLQLFQSQPGQTGGVPKGTATPTAVARAEAAAAGGTSSILADPGGATLVATGGGNQSLNGPAGPVGMSPNGPFVPGSLTQAIQTTAQTQAAFETVPNIRPAGTLSGWFGGLDRWQASPTSPVYQETIYGVTQVTLDPKNNRVQARLSVDGQTIPYGSADLSGPAFSTYDSYDRFTATVPDGTRDVERQLVTGSMTTQGAAGRTLPTMTLCQCDFTRWGFWDASVNGGRESFFGTWVAGRPIARTDVPAVGQATYVGHVVGYAQDIQVDQYGKNQAIGDARLVGGNFTNTVNFAARSAAVTITGLDQTNYAGTMSISSGQFSGSLAGDYGNRQMTLAGSLYKGAASPVGEMGGSVQMIGTNYIGSGIFAARMK